MNTQTIVSIWKDWNEGLTHGQILAKHDVSDAQEFAITECAAGLTVQEVQDRIARVKSGMSAAEIRAIMKNGV